MAALDYHVLDVFTTERFGGNPLAVVLDADGLDGQRMQTIAREFNLSETVFVLKPKHSGFLDTTLDTLPRDRNESAS